MRLGSDSTYETLEQISIKGHTLSIIEAKSQIQDLVYRVAVISSDIQDHLYSTPDGRPDLERALKANQWIFEFEARQYIAKNAVGDNFLSEMPIRGLRVIGESVQRTKNHEGITDKAKTQIEWLSAKSDGRFEDVFTVAQMNFYANLFKLPISFELSFEGRGYKTLGEVEELTPEFEQLLKETFPQYDNVHPLPPTSIQLDGETVEIKNIWDYITKAAGKSLDDVFAKLIANYNPTLYALEVEMPNGKCQFLKEASELVC